MIGFHRKLLISLVLIALANGAGAAKPPETSYDGLALTPSKNVELLYTRPGATLAPYSKIALLDCLVAFKKDWQREQSRSGIRVSSSDMERIKKSLAEEFRKIFSEELTKGGYALTDTGGEDVLILRPAIIDLDITAPDTMSAGRSRSFSTGAGAMTLYIELFDGATGEILARAIDRRAARDNGYMTWQTSVTNRAEAERMLRKWAELARKGLDNARTRDLAAPAAP
jgi:hypothetical protein